MSFDIYALIPARSWPTARQLDRALLDSGYPVRLGERVDTAWEGLLAPVAAEPIRFFIQDANQAQLLGQPIGSEYEFPHEVVMPVTLDGIELEPDFGMEEVVGAEDLNARLSAFDGMPSAHDGDLLIWFSHHTDQRNYNAGMYILAALILQFDGHGFEMQGMSHGKETFAKELLDSLYENPVENPF